jgi:hypothetical protein
MGWETRDSCRGRFYTRSRKVAGRVIREYVGTGAVAELAAAADLLRRGDRRAALEARRAEEASWRAALAPLLELSRAADLLARVTLLIAGFHQHARSSWRKRNVRHHVNATDEGRRDP